MSTKHAPVVRARPGLGARPRPAPSRAGLTLAEVLVTLLIMTILIYSMSQILAVARKSRDTIHNIRETQLAGPAILQLVESDLRALFTYNRAPETWIRVKNRVIAGQDADSLDLVASTNSLVAHRERDRFLRADVNEVGYRLRESPESDEFLELWRREAYGVDDEPFDGGEYVFLHDRVTYFDVTLFDEDGEDAEPLEEWNVDENAGLPKRIEIELELEMAPRLTGEQLDEAVPALSRRRHVYRRVIRLPESLFVAAAVQPVPKIPDVPRPTLEGEGGAAGAGGEESEGGSDVLDGAGGGGGGAFGGGESQGGGSDVLGGGGGGVTVGGGGGQ